MKSKLLNLIAFINLLLINSSDASANWTFARAGRLTKLDKVVNSAGSLSKQKK